MIHTFDDIGENVRAALENDFSHLLVRAGFLFSSDMTLTVSLDPDNISQGGFRFGDTDLEEIMASAFLAHNLRNSNFDVLKHFSTTSREIWEMLIYFLERRGLDEEALSREIYICDDSLQLRLLIKLAGKLKIVSCTEAICKRLFDSIPHHRIIQELQIAVTPFNKVVEETLREMPVSSKPIVEKYYELAKSHKKWQAKQVLEGTLKSMRSK